MREWLLALGAAFAFGCGAQAAPLEAYGKLPTIEQATVSPGGDYLAYVVTNGETRTIAVQTTADRKLLATAGAGTVKVRDLRWAGDGHLLVTASTTRQPAEVYGPRVEYYLAQDLDLKTGRWNQLLENIRTDEMTLNSVLSPPQVRTIDGKLAIFVRGVHFVDHMGQPGLFRIDLPNHLTVMVEPGGRGVYDWVVDSHGRAIARAAYDDKPGIWQLSLKEPSGGWRVIQTITAPIEMPDLAGMGRSDHTILVDLGDEKIGHAWREVSTETGVLGDPVAAADSQSAIHDPATGLLIGNAVLAGDTRTYNFFDPHDAAVWRSVTRAYPGDGVSLESWSDDRTKVIVRVDSAEFGPAYALVDLTSHQAYWLGAEYEDLRPPDISPVKPVHYKAADGLEITGYLTLPRSRDPRGLPLVVLAHGGPASRDMPGFDWWAQALASRGYAVLQANFRGSSGFGVEFYRAGFGQWGRKMQTDLSDGVRDLARQGLIDPKRVCIVGASYGGYAALAGAALDRGVYRCAVSYAGPSDLRSQITDSREKHGLHAMRYWDQFIGAKDLDDPLLAEVSPAAHAADIEIPLLLIHGRDDTVVPIAQSRRMAEAMRRAGKPVELVELKGEDHWLSTGETRLAMLQATVAFLEKNNPPN